jgi:hypothetical protein
MGRGAKHGLATTIPPPRSFVEIVILEAFTPEKTNLPWPFELGTKVVMYPSLVMVRTETEPEQFVPEGSSVKLEAVSAKNTPLILICMRGQPGEKVLNALKSIKKSSMGLLKLKVLVCKTV